VILPMTTKPHARLVAEKLRAAIAAAVIADAGPDGARITISVGVSTFPETPPRHRARAGADAALYAAKTGAETRGGVQRDLD